MSKFFLNIQNGVGFARDEEGQELPNLDAARLNAIEGIRSLLAEEVRGGSLNLRGRIEIADEAGQILAIVPFHEAVALVLDEETR